MSERLKVYWVANGKPRRVVSAKVRCTAKCYMNDGPEIFPSGSNRISRGHPLICLDHDSAVLAFACGLASRSRRMG